MIFGIGTDILKIERIAAAHARYGGRFAQRILMPEELPGFSSSGNPVRYLAMRFAAKEAIVKAMGTGFAHGMGLRDTGTCPIRAAARRSSGRCAADRSARTRCWSRPPDAVRRGRSGGVWLLCAENLTATHEDPGIRYRDGARCGERPASSELEGMPDADVAKAMTFRRCRRPGSEFLPLTSSASWRSRWSASSDGLKVWSLGTPESEQGELVTRFFDGIDRHTPQLVSWNGSGFDLPVLHYRRSCTVSRRHRYWEMATTSGPSATTTISAAFTGGISI